ncbi:hypothetical protein EC988_006631 [Linderina pennispora]|nr:hypothetical protein EC988_006631 [Linderina pennispora]
MRFAAALANVTALAIAAPVDLAVSAVAPTLTASPIGFAVAPTLTIDPIATSVNPIFTFSKTLAWPDFGVDPASTISTLGDSPIATPVVPTMTILFPKCGH